MHEIRKRNCLYPPDWNLQGPLNNRQCLPLIFGVKTPQTGLDISLTSPHMIQTSSEFKHLSPERLGDDIFSSAVMFSYSVCLPFSLASQVCHSCFRHQANLHRCAQCKFAHYCNRTCQTACWDEHKRECGAIRKLNFSAPSENIR